jgi:TolA-binding protein
VTLRSLRYAILVLVILSGCSTYQNVTGYFNTYYNAKKGFGDAVEGVELVRQRGRDTLIIAPYKIDAAAQDKFDKVIEKCSKLIQFYDQSGWVDDAIVMIGESYVYQDENESAIRKFKELFDNFPGSGLINEARLWNAKALYFSGKDDEALRALKELFPEARTEGQSAIMIETLILEAQIYAQRSDYVQAVQTYSLAAEVEGDDMLRCLSQYQAALGYEKLAQFPEAAQAYAAVRKLSPPFEIEFKARLGQGRMLAATGQYAPALRELETLFDEQLKIEERALVDLEIANTDWLMGDSLAAFDLYTHIDTTYRKSEASAKAQYRRGQIFEKELYNYRASREFFDKAKGEFSAADVTAPAQRRAQTFAAYFGHYDDLHRYDSLLAKRLELDSLASSGDTLVAAEIHRDTMAQAADTSARLAPVNVAQESKPALDSAQAALKAPADEADDEDRDRPLGRRRQSGNAPSPSQRAVTRVPKETIASEELRTPKKIRTDSAQAVVAPKAAAPPPQVLLSADSLRALLAQTYFELGGIFMLELQRPDSAERWFGLLLNRFPDSRYTPRTLYALAELRRSENDTAGVDSLYNTLLTRYGTSEYADQIRRVRGLEARAVVLDSSAEEFTQAFRLLDSGRATEAVTALDELVKRHPSSVNAPKAAYTTGWIYENVLGQLDSAASAYERLAAAYPTSVYAGAVQAKLAVKKDPKSLSKFVTVREIPAIPKAAGSLKRGRDAAVPKSGDEDEDLRPGRGRKNAVDVDENADEEEEEEPPPDSDDSDDDNN